jgi:hypothetical protein
LKGRLEKGKDRRRDGRRKRKLEEGMAGGKEGFRIVGMATRSR